MTSPVDPVDLLTRETGSGSPLVTSTVPPSSVGSKELEGVQCRLETKELWGKFHELGTEMIITKTGRWVYFEVVTIT